MVACTSSNASSTHTTLFIASTTLLLATAAVITSYSPNLARLHRRRHRFLPDASWLCGCGDLSRSDKSSTAPLSRCIFATLPACLLPSVCFCVCLLLTDWLNTCDYHVGRLCVCVRVSLFTLLIIASKHIVAISFVRPQLIENNYHDGILF